MLLAHPAVLDDLVRRYTALERELASGKADPTTRQRLADVAYTLCVSTGTRDIDAALVAARHRLPGARTEDDSAVPAVTPAT
ncbi:DUF5133 domain-containing protein [Streptomyces mashuensis]|uniref:DUF5133 domain-containing protein n=1 Tax=Streptomyces mashuensis TaxID=33904 RepID=A0A919B967_9ACTN|nr:DUF5133 domain-containing protein [Streptomyces mashuensis]GHF67504.1 DUF5133 domain-containing protein [Streptomyces mashuensis]